MRVPATPARLLRLPGFQPGALSFATRVTLSMLLAYYAAIAAQPSGAAGAMRSDGGGWRQRVQPAYAPTLSRVTSWDGIRTIGLSGFLPFMMPTPVSTASLPIA